MNPRDLVLHIIPAAIWLYSSAALAFAFIRRRGLYRNNFLNQQIPTGYGLTMLLWTPAAAALMCASGWFDGKYLSTITMAVVWFGVLGLIDDLFGDRSVGGLKGHLRHLVVEKRITTGLIKAVGGALGAVIIVRVGLDSSWPAAILNGAIVALFANTINLLDLRPGRACGAFFVVAACLIALHTVSHETISPLWLVVIPAIVVYSSDFRGLAMIGDTGSNLLGAALGAEVVILMGSVTGRAIVLIGLVLLHLFAERYSISALIDSNCVFRRIDSWTGKRG